MTRSSATWIEEEPAGGDGPEAPGAGGRRTVLPRVEVDGPVPKLVSSERPRFQALNPLGEGGLGQVVAARDLDIGRKVAIKTIRPDRQSNAAFLRFVQEVRIVGQLDHPNIVPVHDVGREDDGSYYFVMKCVEGETLEAVLDRLKAGDRATHAVWTFEKRVEVFRQILRAVSFAHAKGVLHRDLKPANVMVGPFGEVQLLDWGIARPLDAPELASDASGNEANASASLSVTHTRVGALIGTPKYMSPEQARGERVDVQTDVWSLSMLFYELLALRHPLDGLSDMDSVLNGVQHRPITLPSLVRQRSQGPVPAELGWYVMAGLERDKAKRFPTVDAMIERMDRRMDGDIPVQCPLTLQKAALSQTSRFVDRHPWVTLSSLVIGVASLCALVVGSVLGLVTLLVGTAIAVVS